ncbi:MAG TPA: lysophospholipid acyltransferase family protein [Candidatus Deferrimicrobiaceae bacterium]
MNPGSRVAWLAMKGFLSAASLLPLPVLSAVFRALAAACRVLGVRRRVVRENLRAAFGKELTAPELAKIERGCYAEYGRIASEIVASDRLLRRQEGHFTAVGLPVLEEAARSGNGLLILTGHIGNFVVIGHFFRSLGFPMTFVAKRVANEYVNREIEKVYGRHGSTIISVRGFKNDPQGGIRLFRSLKRGDIVVVLVDQDAGPHGYMSSFLGIPTSLPSGPVRFACRAGTPVTTGFATREGGRLRVEIQPLIDYSSAGSPGEAERTILDEYSRRLEAKVRRAPEQYFWFHKKWKSVPEIRARYEGRG